MPSNVETLLTEQRLAGYQARHDTAAPPLVFAADAAERLRKTPGGERALAHLKGTAATASELDAADNALSEQIFAGERVCERLRGELQRAADMGFVRGRAHSSSPLSEREIALAAKFAEEQPARVAAELADRTEALDVLRDRRARAAARARPLRERLRRCEVFIRRNSGLRFLPLPDAKKTTLDQARARVGELWAETIEIALAPRHPGEVKELLFGAGGWLERDARPPNVGRLFDVENRESTPFIGGQEIAGRWIPDALGFALWLMSELWSKDEIAKRLGVDRYAEPGALTADARAQKIAKAKAELLAAMRLEEAVAQHLVRQGQEIILPAIPEEQTWGDNAPWGYAEAVAMRVRAILSVE
jgi:hypothetical protein